MAKLSTAGAKKLLAVTALFVSGVVVGCLAHSEIMHFFAQVLGIE